MTPPGTGGDGAGPAIAVAGLVKRFGRVTAVDGLSLSVRPGECFGLLGPNGAGKTTTIEVLVGLLRPDAGSVRILGREWGGDDRALRARMGVLFQETRFPERLTVREVVSLFRSFYPRGRDPDALVDEVGLGEKARAWTSRLSGGQRQRLALACALVGEPDLLVLDEPTTGLDPQARLLFGEAIAANRREGRTILLSTHYMEEAQRVCDRVAVVDRGKAVAVGAPAALIASLGGEIVVEVELSGAEVADGAIRDLPGVRGVRRENGAIHVSAAEAHVAVPALLDLVRNRGAELSRLTVRHATLEDVYVALTGRRLRDG